MLDGGSLPKNLISNDSSICLLKVILRLIDSISWTTSGDNLVINSATYREQSISLMTHFENIIVFGI